MSDDLNPADVRALVAALHGVRNDLADIKSQNATSTKQSGFQDRAHTNAIDKLTAKVDRLADKIERSLKLTRHVGHEIADSAVKAVREETGKHLLPRPEQDEITGRQWRYLITHKVGPWLAARGFFLKLFAGLAAAAGAAWAYLTHRH